MKIRVYVVPMIATALLAFAGSASAIFIETPLQVAADDTEPENRQTVTFNAEAANNTTREQLAGKSVVVRWSMYDENASQQEPQMLRDDLVLDDQARLTFTWTLPAVVDDRNVFVTIERGEEVLGQAHLGVGDAEPMLMAMNEMAPDDPSPSDRIEEEDHDEPASVPSPGLLAAALGLVLVGVIARRRA